MFSVSSMRSTSKGEGLTGTRTKSVTPRHATVAGERKPGVSMMTRPLWPAKRCAVFQASSEASSTTETPPSPFSRAASRATERWGSASMMVGWWPPRCQYTPRQLASVLFPLPPFMVATVMIELVTVRPPGIAMRRINHEDAITEEIAPSQQLPIPALGGGLPLPPLIITSGADDERFHERRPRWE